MKSFWNTITTPLVGLSPMDGVTDAAYRCMIVRHGKPDVMMTEFVPVAGLHAGITELLVDFIYQDSERPLVAQVFGSEPLYFYEAAFIIGALGFDGMDVNMGCPSKNVSSSGGGAGLIRTPDRAVIILEEARRGLRDWANGMSLKDAGIHPRMRGVIEQRGLSPRRPLPLSVKTRIGFDHDIVDLWIPRLIDAKPDGISLHGRTLKQMYTGTADWSAIARAARLVHERSAIRILGNGDLKSWKDIYARIGETGVDGVLVGRATFGRPDFFSRREDADVLPIERLHWAVDHADLYATLLPTRPFHNMRKHLSWYCKGFEGAAELRKSLMLADSVDHVRSIIESFLSRHDLSRAV